MNLWCPECGGTSFFYSTTNKQEDTNDSDLTIVTDHMKCKSCNKEFNIDWYNYIRNDWVEMQPRYIRKRN
jgi:hypothetical protein